MFEIKITGASFEELRNQAAKMFNFSIEKSETPAGAPIGVELPTTHSTPPTPPAVVAPPVAAATPISVTPPAPVQVPTTPTSYTQDQLAYAAAALMETGKQDALIALLSQFGVQALTQLSVDQYGTFALKLRELGATI